MNHKEAENDIIQLVEKMNEDGKGIPTSLSEVPDFPFTLFYLMMMGLEDGEATLSRHSAHMDSTLFDVLATTGEKVKSYLGLIINYGGIVAALLLSYFYSWWWLAAIPLFYSIGLNLFKKAYDKAIYRSALSSEDIFCFLYFTRQIAFHLLKKNENDEYSQELYFWNMPK